MILIMLMWPKIKLKKHPVDKVVTNFEGGVPFLRHSKQNIDTRFLDADA